MNRAIKGLMIKDLRLLKNQKQFFVVVIGLTIFLVVSMHVDLAFSIGYITMMFTFFTLSTLTYDEYENGATYLFTLPITRKDYVREKYLFGFWVGTVSCSLTSLIIYIVDIVTKNEIDAKSYLVGIGAVLVMAWLLLAVEIPVQLKFGHDKGKMASMVSLVLIVLIVIFLKSIAQLAGMELANVIERIAGLDIKVIALIAIGGIIVILYTSYRISLWIVQKRQF